MVQQNKETIANLITQYETKEVLYIMSVRVRVRVRFRFRFRVKG